MESTVYCPHLCPQCRTDVAVVPRNGKAHCPLCGCSWKPSEEERGALVPRHADGS